MSDIRFSRPHSLGRQQARIAAQRVADEMAQSFQMRSQWVGDVLEFSRTGVSGSLSVLDEEIVLEARLGFLLSAFKPRIEERLQANFDDYFGPCV